MSFSPEINAGHIFEAIVIFITLGGGFLGAYTALHTDIAAIQGRLLVLESRRATDDLFQSETRLALSHALEMLNDIRVNVARGTHKQ